MTTLQEAASKALEYAEAQCGGRCNSEYNPCHAYEVADCLRTALAQQGEPVADVVHVKASGHPEIEWAYTAPLYPSVGTKLYTAAPAPQALTDAEYQRMTTNGAAAWAGVDPQELRTGAA